MVDTFGGAPPAKVPKWAGAHTHTHVGKGRGGGPHTWVATPFGASERVEKGRGPTGPMLPEVQQARTLRRWGVSAGSLGEPYLCVRKLRTLCKHLPKSTTKIEDNNRRTVQYRTVHSQQRTDGRKERRVAGRQRESVRPSVCLIVYRVDRRAAQQPTSATAATNDNGTDNAPAPPHPVRPQWDSGTAQHGTYGTLVRDLCPQMRGTDPKKKKGRAPEQKRAPRRRGRS